MNASFLFVNWLLERNSTLETVSSQLTKETWSEFLASDKVAGLTHELVETLITKAVPKVSKKPRAKKSEETPSPEVVQEPSQENTQVATKAKKPRAKKSDQVVVEAEATSQEVCEEPPSQENTKVKKPRAKKSDQVVVAAEATSEPEHTKTKAKKPRAKKSDQVVVAVAETSSQEIVAETSSQEIVAETSSQEIVAETSSQEIVAETSSQEIVAETSSQEIVAENTKTKVKKPRAKKTESNDAPLQMEDELKAEPIVTSKQKKPRKKAAEPAAAVDLVVVPVEEFVEIQLQDVEIAGKRYLMDENENLYDCNTIEKIGPLESVCGNAAM